jgi:hypothetical protein
VQSECRKIYSRFQFAAIAILNPPFSILALLRLGIFAPWR